MFALVSPNKIQLPAGAVVRLPATWQDYQKLCQQRGDGSIPRIKYRIGEVLLRNSSAAIRELKQQLREVSRQGEQGKMGRQGDGEIGGQVGLQPFGSR